MSATCRSCGAHVTWALMESGKRMPLDVQPVHEGTRYRLAPRSHGDDEPVYIRVLEEGAHGYRSHFSSCPDADKHRRPR